MSWRVLGMSLVALLVLSPLAAAQDDGRDGSSGPGSPSQPPPDERELRACMERAHTEEERQACKARWCEGHPDDSRCACLKDPSACREGKPAPSAQPTCSPQPGSRDRPRDACAPGCDGRKAPPERCKAVEEFRARQGNVVGFRILENRSGLADYRVGGVLALDLLLLESNATPAAERHGAVLEVRAGDDRLEVHDEPGGLVRFLGQNGTLLLVLPANATVEAGEHGAMVRYAAASEGPHAGKPVRGMLRADNATWLSGREVRIAGFASFHLVPDPPLDAADRPGPTMRAELREKVERALERRHVGAEVALRDPSLGDEAVQVLAYDNVTVLVEAPGAGAPVRVQLAAELSEGRTIVLQVDPAVLAASDPSRLVLRYFDVNPDGSETEVVFRQAGSLSDVLDPTDDAGQPEYWVVTDADGMQVMVSVPRWSVHAVTLSSLGELLTPSVLAGLAAGIAGSVLAAAALFWPRRRDA